MIKLLKGLKNNDGATLKNGKLVTYKKGYQVATEGMETTSAEEAVKMIEAYGGNCGVWYSEGIYYIDKSYHVSSKTVAIEMGIKCNQQSILKWSDMSLIWCK